MEVLVRREHRQFIADAEPDQQRVDCPDLDAAAAAGIAQLGRFDMVPPIGDSRGTIWLVSRARYSVSEHGQQQ